MKFRKKPVVIEAVQYTGDKPWPEGVTELPEHVAARLTLTAGLAWCETLEGGHIVSPGDWIITGVKGEKYPCKPDIFLATYEPA